MSWYKEAEKLCSIKDENFEAYNKKYKKEMEDWFNKRTNKHIECVKEYCQKIFDYDEERFEGIVERGEAHDDSKFKSPEKEPYIYITWQYKCKESGEDYTPPEDLEERMDKASEHHILNNKHHPESHCEKEVDLINRDDRDKPPDEMIDATKMGDLDIGEMVADWMSMSEEKGGNPKEWAEKNVNIRWKFDKKQEDLIYELIEEIWEDNKRRLNG